MKRGRLPFVLTLLCAAATALAAPPATLAANRLDRAAAALKRDPLYVHPDVLWLLPEGARARAKQELRRAREPIRVAVMPLVEEDESGGQAGRVLYGIQRRVGRPGLYILMSDLTSFAAQRSGDGRGLGLPVDLQLPPSDADPHEQALPRLMAAIRVAPGARPLWGEPDSQPLIEIPGQDEPTPWRDALIAAGAGLLAGILAFGALSTGRRLLEARRGP